MKIATLMTSAALVAFSASAFAAGDRVGPNADPGAAQGNAAANADANGGVAQVNAAARTSDDTLNAAISRDPRVSGSDAASRDDDDNELGDRADDAEDAVSDAADDVGDALEDAADDVEDFFD